MARAVRRSSLAEEWGAIRQIEETDILLGIAEQETDHSSLDPAQALRLARAARETLLSEERLAVLKLREFETIITGLQDAVEEAHARVEEADYQVGSILSYLNSAGIRIPQDSTTKQKESLSFASSLSDLETEHKDSGLFAFLTSDHEALDASDSDSGVFFNAEHGGNILD